MGSKNVLLFNLAVLALLLFLLAASAGVEPLVGKLVGGKPPLGQSRLKCCDDCVCDRQLGYCTCWDWKQSRCTPGCRRCVCDRVRPIFCRCADWLDTCPRTCSCRGDAAPDTDCVERAAST